MLEPAVVRVECEFGDVGRVDPFVGDRLTLCRKVMGRKRGEPLVRIAEVEVVSVRREPLCAIVGNAADLGAAELALEGFPGMDATEFMRRFFLEAQGIEFMDEITRIEWRYLPDFPIGGAR